ncbi:MAG: glycoside-pentoside-hexuronide (GPH):cation symporter [Clostridium sp.]|nr:glycoside-pentoside-hexuronide (GPH):cation symporter [Clostridium sp.]MDY4934121.1 glycoside-pentoside-hexuronide (GPH):cation symporter [Eubacteriales bacterium]
MEETISKKPNVISRLKTELKKPFTKNMLMFSLGTIGRDFLYFLFNSFLMTFILFTKTIDNKMLTVVGAIIVVARIFDALNDPIMGGIVENTRTKWGKYKPWQLLGAVLTGAVIISVFCVKLDGWSYIGFLAFAYLMFSITFTMNDISYWGMLPSLTSDEHERNKLTSCAQLLASAGIGLATLLIPLFTTGSLAKWGAPTGYKVIGIISAVLMVLFQLFTILGVKEKPLPPIKPDKSDRLTLKKMFQTIAKNDQLLWCALIMLIFSTGTSVVGSGLLTMYVYFEFGYEGGYTLLIGIGYGIISTLFTATYPWLSKKFGRNKVLYSAGVAIILGFILMLIFALAIPTGAPKSTEWFTKFILIAIAYTIVGYGMGFYMIMVINMANTVEYNEWKYGQRNESLIFSLRPFTAKLSSALTQALVIGVYAVASITTYTNAISDVENEASKNLITNKVKMEKITEIINKVSLQDRQILAACMCIIPIVFMIVALILYKKKCTLSETRLAEMVRETEARKLALAGATENTDEPVAFEEPVAEESALANDVVSPLSEIAENVEDAAFDKTENE